MKIKTRKDLIEYCLRNLGKPVIEINVSCEQIEDRIDDAIQRFEEEYHDGLVRNFYKHKITATDVQNNYITIPDRIIYLTRALPFNNNGGSLFDLEFQLYDSDVFHLIGGLHGGNVTGFDVTSYILTNQYLALIDQKFNSNLNVEFSKYENKVGFHEKNILREGNWIVLEVYETKDPEDYPRIYNNEFIKKYATALIKAQWGRNLSKFADIQMPGGVTFSGREILDDAMNEIEQIEEDLKLKDRPTSIFMG